jgi:protein gp37
VGDKSRIEWTDATWNPVTGCSKVSPGCAHCYAETLALNRFAGKPGYPGLPWTPENAAENVVLRPERLDQPLKWTRPRMVFVNSMSDLFHELVPEAFIERVFWIMYLAHRHTFQVLTKRPERMAEVVPRIYESFRRINGGVPVPFPNVWLGTSIENRRYVGRADDLRGTPAAVRFISAEPLLGPLVPELPSGVGWDDGYLGEQLDLWNIDWLIVGGESGPEHRRMDEEWVHRLHEVARNSHTAFFFKQWGGRTPKAGGRLLSGRTWDEMPVAPAVVAA